MNFSYFISYVECCVLWQPLLYSAGSKCRKLVVAAGPRGALWSVLSSPLPMNSGPHSHSLQTSQTEGLFGLKCAVGTTSTDNV